MPTTLAAPATRTHTLRGAFDLTRSAAFGFGQRDAAADPSVMRLGFLLEPGWTPVGVQVRQPDPGTLLLEVTGAGADPDGATVDAAVAQALRVLSADVDARPWDALAATDPVLARFVATVPGLRPPLFHSAYEALAWCILSARRPAAQGAALRERLSRAHGTVLTVGGEVVPVLPTPEQLLAVDAFPSLPEVKLRRLHGLARAALDGRLDTASLRALDPAEAAARLRELEGIGPYYAELVVVRALGDPDVVPVLEPAVLAVTGALLTGNGPLTPDGLAEHLAPWAPWRAWACVTMRSAAPALLGPA